jgi:hypothetical protein
MDLRKKWSCLIGGVVGVVGVVGFAELRIRRIAELGSWEFADLLICGVA